MSNDDGIAYIIGGIGGIVDADRVAHVQQAGAQGVAVIGAVTQATDVPAVDGLPSCTWMLITRS
jgi:thiamine monophosphate synthase